MREKGVAARLSAGYPPSPLLLAQNLQNKALSFGSQPIVNGFIVAPSSVLPLSLGKQSCEP
jgi:hypothetical protein